MDVPLDTDGNAYAAQIAAYRRMGEAGRAQSVFRLNELARRFSVAGIRSRHPEYDDQQVQRAYARLRLGDALVSKVWPEHDLVDP
jgi:hypothetical protein